MSDKCPVCKTVLNEKTPTRNSACPYIYDCPCCGKFVFAFNESDIEREFSNSDDNDKWSVLTAASNIEAALACAAISAMVIDLCSRKFYPYLHNRTILQT